MRCIGNENKDYNNECKVCSKGKRIMKKMLNNINTVSLSIVKARSSSYVKEDSPRYHTIHLHHLINFS